MSKSATNLRSAALLPAIALAASLGVAPAAIAQEAPVWRPESAERLVQLPPEYLQKSLEYDFSQSSLGAALGDVGTEIEFKNMTLTDLRDAIRVADGEMRTELRHQYLAEKSQYLELAGSQNAMERRHLETKLAALEGVMSELLREQGEMTPTRRDLVQNQLDARRRLESSVAQVDLRLLEATMAPESRYSQEYAANFAAIQALTQAITNHPMNAVGEDGEVPTTQRDAVLDLIANAQAQIAILDQEEQVLGYMAKLVALDAMALSEEIMGTELAVMGVEAPATVRTTVEFFVTN